MLLCLTHLLVKALLEIKLSSNTNSLFNLYHQSLVHSVVDMISQSLEETLELLILILSLWVMLKMLYVP